MKNLAAIVLAAGKGTRMKSRIPKVLHPIAGHAMLHYPIGVLKGLKAGKVVVVTGHGAEAVEKALSGFKGLTFVHQAEQKGTGHAVMCAARELKAHTGDVIILSGDVPLITPQTVKALLKVHRGKRGAPISFISAVLGDPSGYGRVVRDPDGKVTGIVEDKDCTAPQRKINEVNAGVYMVNASFLLKNINRISPKNAQKEYYLPDLVRMAVEQGGHVPALTHLDASEVMGINNRVELARANSIMRERVLRELMLSGVTIVDPGATYIDVGARIGVDTLIYPNVHINGGTTIGENCVIEEGARIEDSAIAGNTKVKSYSIIESTSVGKDVTIGPFARLRPGNVIGDRARIGNFVEVKKSIVGTGSKANHLSYLGDSEIGDNVNIGAGTITCNYDGVKKHRTVIEDNAFIGSDTQLVAPVRVGKNAYVGSGTTVTKDVPSWSLVITRANERVVEGWAKRKIKK